MTHVVDEPVPPMPAYPYPVYQPDRFTRLLNAIARRSPTWAGPAAILTCFATSAAYVLYTDPTDANALSTPSCLIKLTTGFDCPGCGGTRAFWYVLHGNIPAAARHHALAVFAFPFLVYMYVAWTAKTVFNRQIPQLRISPRIVASFLAVWAVFSIARNLPWAPFTWLYV